ncbi:hypothetical protein [Paenibacillus elgii]|uniref:hypothetical protein n=1 Tax=Paenibacillus elgii TaxID=189691 RepID=UPI000248D36F|nr:hypothetical protein [Paenibacillus elgii]
MRINVTYAVNQLAGTGKIKMERHFATIIVESDLTDERALHDEIKRKLSELESLPQNEIKVLSYSEI